MIPAQWKTHKITVEAYTGSGAHGPTFAAPAQVHCLVEEEVQLVRDNTGAEVVSSTVVFCDPDVVVPVESRVTVNGRTSSVLHRAEHTSGGRSRWDHVEVFLQ